MINEIKLFNSFSPREKWIQNIQSVVSRSDIRIKRLQNTPNQVRISSTLRKTKSEHPIWLHSWVIFLQSWYV